MSKNLSKQPNYCPYQATIRLPPVPVFAECPNFQPEFPRPGLTLVGMPNVPIFGSDVPLVETNFYHARKCVRNAILQTNDDIFLSPLIFSLAILIYVVLNKLTVFIVYVYDH
jgi:hypothetical protein